MLHICVSEPVQIMVCRLFCAKPLSIPMFLLSTGPLGTNLSKFLIKIQNFWITKLYLKILSAKWQPYCPEGDELTEPMLTYHQWDSVVLTQDHFHKKCSRYHFIKVWKTTFVDFFHISGSSELKMGRRIILITICVFIQHLLFCYHWSWVTQQPPGCSWM